MGLRTSKPRKGHSKAEELVDKKGANVAATLAKQTEKSLIEGESNTEEGNTGGEDLVDILSPVSNEGGGGEAGGDAGATLAKQTEKSLIEGESNTEEGNTGGEDLVDILSPVSNEGGGGEAGGDAGGSADLRIVLIGKTGAGKSSTGNAILGDKKLFKTSNFANSDTVRCKAETKPVNGRKITVIDTPGYCCTVNPDEKLKPEIFKCIMECAPGPHAFVIVLSVGRQTEEEKKVVYAFQEMFGEGALEYTVVLFTHGDQIAHENVTIQEFVDTNIHLKTLVQKCGNRFLSIDNLYWNVLITDRGDETRNSREIESLLNTIHQMGEQNGHYTNEMLQAVAEAIEKVSVDIRKETGGQLNENTVKEKAKEILLNNFLKQAAGVTTGGLMGAFLGAIATASVVAAVVASAGVAAVVIGATGIVLGAAFGAVAGSNAADNAKNPKEAAMNTFQCIRKQKQKIESLK